MLRLREITLTTSLLLLMVASHDVIVLKANSTNYIHDEISWSSTSSLFCLLIQYFNLFSLYILYLINLHFHPLRSTYIYLSRSKLSTTSSFFVLTAWKVLSTQGNFNIDKCGTALSNTRKNPQ